MGKYLIVEISKNFIIWLTPLVFLSGLLLVLSLGKYDKIGEVFDKERGFKFRLIPSLEKNIYVIHNWLLKRQLFLGLVLMLYSVLLLLVMLAK